MITAEPDVTVTTLSPEDEFLVLACDGVWDCMTSQEAVSIVQYTYVEYAFFPPSIHLCVFSSRSSIN